MPYIILFCVSTTIEMVLIGPIIQPFAVNLYASKFHRLNSKNKLSNCT